MKANAIFFDESLSYNDGLQIQESILEARIKDLIPDTVLFLEHLPVITCGVRSKPEQILLSPEELKARQIEVSKSSRGGAVTFHGPGQLIMYPIIKLGTQQLKTVAGLDEAGPGSFRFAGPATQDKPSPTTNLTFSHLKLGGNKTDVHGYLYNLEEVAIRTAASFGVTAYRRKGMTGAWTDEGKLAAIGVRFKRWVTFHGMSFNVAPDLSGFSAIIPCGLAGEKVTSLKILLGNACPSLEKARDIMINQFSVVFGRKLSMLNYKCFSGDQLPFLLATLENIA